MRLQRAGRGGWLEAPLFRDLIGVGAAGGEEEAHGAGLGAVEFESASVQLDDLPRHRQPEAEADGALGVKWLGGVGRAVGVEAAPRVAHVNPHPAGAVGLDFCGGGDFDGLVAGRGLKCVEEDLGEGVFEAGAFGDE